MMELPERIEQKQAESDSYAILLYKLRGIGIFRNLTENDYGIDFEIELIEKSSVTGRYFKAQVKSAEKLYVRKDDIPTVGGIKQSTLNYWCELSFRTHVLAYAVNLKSESIYISRPLFWQASALIDGSKKSKTIEFLPEKKGGGSDEIVTLSRLFGYSPSVPDVLYAVTTGLRHLRDFFELYIGVFHYDAGGEIENPVIFHAFLDVCKILLWCDIRELGLPDEDKAHAFRFAYWAKKWDSSSEEVTNMTAQIPMKAMMPLFINALARYREAIVNAAWYWSNRNLPFLELVYTTSLPAATDDPTLSDWGYKYDQLARPAAEPFSFFLRRMREKVRQQRAESTDDGVVD
jgi:hypothetical protein